MGSTLIRTHLYRCLWDHHLGSEEGGREGGGGGGGRKEEEEGRKGGRRRRRRKRRGGRQVGTLNSSVQQTPYHEVLDGAVEYCGDGQRTHDSVHDQHKTVSQHSPHLCCCSSRPCNV